MFQSSISANKEMPWPLDKPFWKKLGGWWKFGWSWVGCVVGVGGQNQTSVLALDQAAQNSEDDNESSLHFK